MTVTLYKTASSKATVSKVLTDANQRSGSFRKNDIPNDRDPVVIVDLDITTTRAYNYCYVSAFDAYYYVRDREALSNETTQLTLHKDVLKTFDSAIRSHTALVKRQESVRQQYAEDPMYKTIDSEIVYADAFGSINTVPCDFILAVAGD